MKEFGEPYALLQNAGSLLQRIVRQTGSNASKKLSTMAYLHHYHKYQERPDVAGASDLTLLAEYVIHYT